MFWSGFALGTYAQQAARKFSDLSHKERQGSRIAKFQNKYAERNKAHNAVVGARRGAAIVFKSVFSRVAPRVSELP